MSRAEVADKQTVKGVLRMIADGQLNAAEEFCETWLQSNRDDVNMVAMLGLVLFRQQRIDDARVVLERARQLAPDFARPSVDLGLLELQTDNLEAAVAALERAVELDPQQIEARSGLVEAHTRLGDPESAQRHHDALLAISPLAKTMHDATRLAADGELQRAEALCEAVLDKEPSNPQALRLLARIATSDERYVVAEGLLKRLVSLLPGDYRAHSELARFYADRGRLPDAVEEMQRAIAIAPDVGESHRFLGDFLSVLGRFETAKRSYEQAVEINRSNVTALAGLGHMQRVLGDKNAAIAAYRQAIACKEDFGEAWWSLTSVGADPFEPQQIARLRKLAASDSVADSSRVALHFALARNAERDNDFDYAWRHYVEGNAMKRKQVRFDPVERSVYLDSIVATYGSELLDSAVPSEANAATPIFIVGLPRSGTTLVEQILASHGEVEGCGELPYVVMLSRALDAGAIPGMSTEQWHGFGATYLYHSKQHRPLERRYFTDKMPANFEHIGLIHLSLPGARIIDVRRNPLDSCIANFRQLFAQGKHQTYDLTELADYYLDYLRLMEHWECCLPGRVLTVHYETLVQDQRTETRRILDYCQLPWDDACLEFHRTARAVNTASSEQVRQPLYQTSIGHWRNYAKHLTELREILAPALPGQSV